MRASRPSETGSYLRGHPRQDHTVVALQAAMERYHRQLVRLREALACERKVHEALGAYREAWARAASAMVQTQKRLLSHFIKWAEGLETSESLDWEKGEEQCTVPHAR